MRQAGPARPNPARLHLVALLCSLALVPLSSCDSAMEPWVTPDDVLVPLDVGNWWEYEVRITGGPLYFRETVFETVEVPVRGTTVTAGAVATDNGTEPPYKWLRANGPSGLHILGGVAPSDTFYTDAVRYRYPAKVGDKWKSPQLAFSRSKQEFYVSSTLEVTLVDDDKVVVTPAGTFVCHVYKFSQRPANDVLAVWDYFMFYAPGIGLIMQQTYSPSDDSIKDETILTRYHIAGQNDQ